jgi:hypothetical protein
MEALTSLLSWTHLLTAAGVYSATVAFYRLFLHPLARFPGPRLAALTLWYETYYDVVQNGQYIFRIVEMHKKYGKPLVLHVVRAKEEKRKRGKEEKRKRGKEEKRKKGKEEKKREKEERKKREKKKREKEERKRIPYLAPFLTHRGTALIRTDYPHQSGRDTHQRPSLL